MVGNTFSDDANPRSGGRSITSPSSCLIARFACGCPRIGTARRDVARATGRHTEYRGDHVLRENLREPRHCGLRRVNQLRRSMISRRCRFGRLEFRGGSIAMLMCLGERETRGWGCRRRWRERLRAHVIEQGRRLRREARWGRCGGSKDGINQGQDLCWCRRWDYKGK